MSEKQVALECAIRAVEASGSVQLEAVVSAAKGATGSYEFVASKTGGGGSSDVTQGGTFEVGTGEAAVIGEATIGSGQGAKIEARLTVKSDRGSASCKAHYPEDL